MTNNLRTATTWSQIAKTIAAKTGDDYQTKVKPTVKSSRNRLGALIEKRDGPSSLYSFQA